MRRLGSWLLTCGLLLFLALLVSQGLPAILATLAAAGWGLLAVALFHLIPLGSDAAAIRVLYQRGQTPHGLLDAVLARWIGESANSLMPAGQLGGPVFMARYLAQRGMPIPQAAAVITVSTTLQTFAQILFALLGVLLLGARAGGVSEYTLRSMALIASGFLALQIVGFYYLQRRGFFSKLLRLATRLAGSQRWSGLMSQAQAIDAAVHETYACSGPVAASFLASLVGWLVGAGEVYLILLYLGHPVGWVTSLLLESLGQAVRGAAFAVPGALGVQETGYVLLAPLAGLSAEVALALSLAKRVRELLLGLPGLLYLHLSGRSRAAAARAVPP
ncbi:MAG TPA: flippase-like domain-containing protein [Steroidobacteraceae bacterium]|jgi:putative membrane protein|nr:flippase-like domain-containing protein [Steroidobacteraceae bacterium]